MRLKVVGVEINSRKYIFISFIIETNYTFTCF